MLKKEARADGSRAGARGGGNFGRERQVCARERRAAQSAAGGGRNQPRAARRTTRRRPLQLRAQAPQTQTPTVQPPPPSRLRLSCHDASGHDESQNWTARKRKRKRKKVETRSFGCRGCSSRAREPGSRNNPNVLPSRFSRCVGGFYSSCPESKFLRLVEVRVDGNTRIASIWLLSQIAAARCTLIPRSCRSTSKPLRKLR